MLGSLDNLKPVVSKQMPISACSVGLIPVRLSERESKGRKKNRAVGRVLTTAAGVWSLLRIPCWMWEMPVKLALET